jgi:hypothetical protein
MIQDLIDFSHNLPGILLRVIYSHPLLMHSLEIMDVTIYSNQLY